MNDYHPLIRLHKWQLDEKRRQHAELLKLHDGLVAQHGQFETTMRIEQEVVGASSEMAFGYDGYIQRSILQRENLRRSLSEVEAALSESQDELSEAFQELKKFELAAAHAQDRRKAEQERRQRIEMDELAIDMHRRGTGT